MLDIQDIYSRNRENILSGWETYLKNKWDWSIKFDTSPTGATYDKNKMMSMMYHLDYVLNRKYLGGGKHTRTLRTGMKGTVDDSRIFMWTCKEGDLSKNNIHFHSLVHIPTQLIKKYNSRMRNIVPQIYMDLYTFWNFGIVRNFKGKIILDMRDYICRDVNIEFVHGQDKLVEYNHKEEQVEDWFFSNQNVYVSMDNIKEHLKQSA